MNAVKFFRVFMHLAILGIVGWTYYEGALGDCDGPTKPRAIALTILAAAYLIVLKIADLFFPNEYVETQKYTYAQWMWKKIWIPPFIGGVAAFCAPFFVFWAVHAPSSIHGPWSDWMCQVF